MDAKWSNLIVFIGVLLFAALVGGCAHPYTTPEVNRTWLNFLQDNRTTRQQVVTKLGEPTASFENGRIVAYRLIGPNAPDPARDIYLFKPLDGIPPIVARAPEPLDEVDWSVRLEWSLVLVYDPQQIVMRHSVVRRF